MFWGFFCLLYVFSLSYWLCLFFFQGWSLFTKPHDFFDILSHLETRLVDNFTVETFTYILNLWTFFRGKTFIQHYLFLSFFSIAERQGMKRGWFTYTDLCVLLEQSAWSQALTTIYQHFTKVRGGFFYKRENMRTCTNWVQNHSAQRSPVFLKMHLCILFCNLIILKSYHFDFQVSCMLGLVYLTSVAGLIATSAVLHQLSLSRTSQSPLAPQTKGPTDYVHTSALNPDTSAAAHHLPCCVLANQSVQCQTGATTEVEHQRESPTSASSQTSLLCLWGSLFASLGHTHPETTSDMETSQTWSTASYFCPGCLATLQPLQCGFKNTSALYTRVSQDNHQDSSLWQITSSLVKATLPSLDSHFGGFPSVQLGSCHPSTVLPVEKVPALLMPG